MISREQDFSFVLFSVLNPPKIPVIQDGTPKGEELRACGLAVVGWLEWCGCACFVRAFQPRPCRSAIRKQKPLTLERSHTTRGLWPQRRQSLFGDTTQNWGPNPPTSRAR